MEEKCVLEPGRPCIGKEAVIKLEMRVEALEKWQEGSREFHENFYNWQRGQIAREAKLDEQIKTIDQNLNKLVAWQEAQQEKPGKRWDGLVEKVIGLVVAAVVGFVLAKIGI